MISKVKPEQREAAKLALCLEPHAGIPHRKGKRVRVGCHIHPRCVVLTFWVTPEEFLSIRDRAKSLGLSQSEFIRERLRSP